MLAAMTADAILAFWFTEITPAQWWKVDPAFDAALAERFGALHAAAVQGELHAWRATPRGRLAEGIVLDQFSRNIHRGLAQEAVAGGHDMALPPAERRFLYMPWMHSESRAIHAQAVELFTRLGDADVLRYERAHQAIVDRFGRYPHRNAVLGRASTLEEMQFLREPGSRF